MAEQATPNILWITAEDMSPTVGCYGDEFATTPNIDRLASEGVRYTHAFATAPVCSPSRCCLINGLPATSLGAHNMRSAFPIPNYMTGFPSLLRDTGYYTSNNVKTDYNNANSEDIISHSWNENSSSAHWRSANDGQPFFSVFNLMTSHQSRTMVWPYEQFVSEVQSQLSADEIHKSDKVTVPPYYPDTPVIRKTLARYYDCVSVMDKQVGDILKQLEEDGLADDTIVFFYSDHGSGMPRHKRALLDTGMRVPLIVRFPEKYRHLAPSATGTTTDRLVSFDDFGPTVLSLVGLEIPEYMEGLPFLGAHEAAPREYVFGHRDRVDEVNDLSRSVRDRRYLYIRNYMSHLGYNQPTAWPDQGEIRHEIYREASTRFEELTSPQRHFASPTRPLEELYDCDADPQNLTNLADSSLPEHTAVLKRMRTRLAEQVAQSRDLGFLPEAYAWTLTEGTTPYEVARTQSETYSQVRLVGAASDVGRGTTEQFITNLASADAGVRYWGAVGFAASQQLNDSAVAALSRALNDTIPNVRIEAAGALARHGHLESSIPILAEALSLEDLAAVQHAARTIELLGADAAAARDAMARCDARMKVIRPPGTSPVVVDPEKDAAMFVTFSTDAFLKQFDSQGRHGSSTP